MPIHSDTGDHVTCAQQRAPWLPAGGGLVLALPDGGEVHLTRRGLDALGYPHDEAVEVLGTLIVFRRAGFDRRGMPVLHLDERERRYARYPGLMLGTRALRFGIRSSCEDGGDA